MRRRTTLVLLALAVLSALVAGYLIVRPLPVNESERYRDDVAVLGHQRVVADSSRWAYAFFVGEDLSDSEVAISVTAPLVRWFHEATYTNGDLLLVVEGYGELDDVRCFIKVQRVRPKAAVRIVGAQNITPQQQAGLNDGSLEALKIMVLCDPQDTQDPT